MADFVGALKKTLDGLGNPTPETRARVYDKARSTIADKLAKNIPPLAPSVVAQHKRTLEDAIASVEREYAKPAPASDPLSELEDIFSSIDRNKNQPSHVRQPAKTEPAWQPAKTEPAWQPAKTEPAWQPAPAAKAAPNWQKPPSVASPPERTDAVPSDADLPAADEKSYAFRDDVFPNDEEPAPDTFPRLRPAERRRSYGGLIAAVVALLVVAGGGYGIWLNKDAFSNMLGLNSTTVATIEPLVKPTPAEPVTDAAARPPAAAAPTDAEGTKFTQRLTPEGGEVDPGPASGQSGIGEGESVAALTTPPPAEPAPAAPTGATPATNAPATPGAAPATPSADGATPAPAAPADSAAAPAAPAPGTATAVPAETALAVGQKAIFYEERTSTAQGSAEPGSIVWSLVQESPGGNLPPEPAIRAEASIPGKDVQLRMTIRRNTDQTLPASHIIEMIFLTPDGFEGGGVDNILRVAMKGSEQDAGSPLIGIPAKIADGFFLVALNDTKADEDANLTLLRGQNWIDVPVVYKTGRRALLTMEKGIPGEKVFDEALKAWQTKTAG
ncbi:MAG: hypothetical protein E5X53_28925 [Mesorhizobium sp.]|uniref:hypothetical protein n=1 Tax=Mesorhizobium sp. TaxID=1871066 RepID=UPI000FE9FA67|nr:hypothetical protein [Mesorhizobium sp.]RWM21951.1 MAG: hypothetical protein EOR73_08750 [Mesorhizobium sp.]TIP72756.1 MAG: hypothetical protein E5X55_16530 [Mesorhizobium sp.]TIQ11562.1 MAG: hypothetical protein E5X57_17330 [Mesorhizobium sp.]TIR48466.1 MAG: hypothetical protein E5X53_28925 [Mesorhizobium sp.]TJV95201.1 MAG: hypothetical protein E5X52_25150 [Mesorhizobium sp.]